MAVSERLKRLPKALVENGGVLGKSMEAVGYAKAYAKNPQKIRETEGWKEVMEPVVRRLERARDQALKRMEETVNEADYAAVSASAERLTKQIQVLTGKPTENVNIMASKSDDELKRIIEAGSGTGTGQEGIGA